VCITIEIGNKCYIQEENFIFGYEACFAHDVKSVGI